MQEEAAKALAARLLGRDPAIEISRRIADEREDS
jgi:hypothetical protein